MSVILAVIGLVGLGLCWYGLSRLTAQWDRDSADWRAFRRWQATQRLARHSRPAPRHSGVDVDDGEV